MSEMLPQRRIDGRPDPWSSDPNDPYSTTPVMNPDISNHPAHSNVVQGMESISNPDEQERWAAPDDYLGHVNSNKPQAETAADLVPPNGGDGGSGGSILPIDSSLNRMPKTDKPEDFKQEPARGDYGAYASGNLASKKEL